MQHGVLTKADLPGYESECVKDSYWMIMTKEALPSTLSIANKVPSATFSPSSDYMGKLTTSSPSLLYQAPTLIEACVCACIAGVVMRDCLTTTRTYTQTYSRELNTLTAVSRCCQFANWMIVGMKQISPAYGYQGRQARFKAFFEEKKTGCVGVIRTALYEPAQTSSTAASDATSE